MVTVADIGWGSYKQYSGPYYWGKYRYVLPDKPSVNERLMAVVTATEGGHYDAFNGYDVCGWTLGIIQWCEMGQYSVSDMLGVVADRAPGAMRLVTEQCANAGVIFRKNARGRYRFHFLDERGEVDRKQEQQQLFYLDGDGTHWSDEAKVNAKKWAVALSSVWTDPTAREGQLAYTAPRMLSFALKEAAVLTKAAPPTDLGEAFIAAYTSFAANNPTRANTALLHADRYSNASRYSREWLIAVLKSLTFSSGIAIYPKRYDKIRPVLEKLYGLDLPDFSEELQKWKDDRDLRWVLDTKELQSALITLGFDLGPSGADGKFGPKTRDAVITFDRQNGMDSDGYPDELTVKALEKALEKAGQTKLLDAGS